MFMGKISDRDDGVNSLIDAVVLFFIVFIRVVHSPLAVVRVEALGADSSLRELFLA